MNIQTILEFVVALGSLILIHEIGHFVACLILKIPVEEFGIGFPPRAITLFQVRGIKFSLNWLPFGGFVRAKGETDPEVPDGLMASNPWKRIAVFLAGPAMNLTVAVILYIAIYASLNYLPDRSRVQLLDVLEDSPAALAGLQTKDVILQVGDEVINSTTELRKIIYSSLGSPLEVSYERDGLTAGTVLTPLKNPGENGAVGIYMSYDTKPFNIFAAVPEGFISTYEYCRDLLSMIGRLITGQIPAEEGRLLGFKGMYDLYSEVRDSETTAGVPAITNVFSYVIMITISLGLFNLLPVPALDGGRIAFALPEIILRRRIPYKFELAINFVSFALLLILLVVINLQDFINPVNFSTP
jgi:regulator of sigma E protease